MGYRLYRIYDSINFDKVLVVLENALSDIEINEKGKYTATNTAPELNKYIL